MVTTPPASFSLAPSDVVAGLSPPRRDCLVKDLVACGLLQSYEAVLQELMLVPVGRSHSVWRLEQGGRPVAAVKLFDPRSSETEGEAMRELLVHDLGREVPDLARLLSPVRTHRGAPELIATDWFEGRPAWEGDALTSALPAGAAADFGALVPLIAPALARMHRATAKRLRDGTLDTRFNGPLPWGLRLFDGDAPAELWANPLLTPILNHAAARPALVAGLRRTRGAWRAVALIHGDLKHDNLLVGPGDRVVVIDWEMAAIGDPAWDLAGIMCRPLLVDESEAGDWSDDAIAVARALIGAYRSVAPMPAAALAQRLVLYCGAWLLMSVIQYRSAVADADETAIMRLVGLAEACVTDAAGITQRLMTGADVG
jgi:Ser/Thr protein kinase RdoA (MazF antagonist)